MFSVGFRPEAGVHDMKKIDHRAIASELPGEFAARN
jgi:hypothetical protein